MTINLAPADVKKDSAALDLPIAAACMLAGGQFFSERIDDYLRVRTSAASRPANEAGTHRPPQELPPPSAYDDAGGEEIPF